MLDAGLNERPLNFRSAEAAAAAAATAAVQVAVSELGPLAKPRPKSVYYGVCARVSKWKAQINYGGKQQRQEAAALSYDEAALYVVLAGGGCFNSILYFCFLLYTTPTPT